MTIDADEKSVTRIQRERRAEILAAALDVFSTKGFDGASINQIAKNAKMSTPRLLYHFNGKETLYKELLKATILLWKGPLELVQADGDPVEEICEYVRRKLQMSAKYRKESRLFASEILMGVPRAREEVFEPLRLLFDKKVALLETWISSKKIAVVDPHHLIYSIWATTQHYADFETQIEELSPHKMKHLYTDAEAFLIPMYRNMLTVS